jgi:hypothetical protein
VTEGFADFTSGKFDSGLRKLARTPFWAETSENRHGPFFLGFPGVAGWGEGLLVACLLKRLPRHEGQIIVASAPKQLCEVLKRDSAFGLNEASRIDEKMRSPLSLLRSALEGRLLRRPFVPLSLGQPLRRSNTRPKIGIAWASIASGKPIKEKKVPVDEFMKIVDAPGVDFILFQRDEFASRTKVIEEYSARCACGLDDEDTEQIINELSQIDYMVTISQTYAHLAAGMGVPVLLLAAKRNGHQWVWRVQHDFGKTFYDTVQISLGVSRSHWWESVISKARDVYLKKLQSIQEC